MEDATTVEDSLEDVTQAALLLRVRRLEAALGAIADAVRIEADGEAWVNGAWATLHGVPATRATEIQAVPLRQDHHDELQRAARSGRSFRSEVQLRRADGTVVDVDLDQRVHTGEGGGRTRILVGRDPVDAHRTLRSLKDALWRTERAIAAAGLGCWWWEADSGLLRASAAAAAQWSLPSEPTEAPGLWWLAHVHPEDRPLLAFELGRLLAAGSGRLETEFRHRTPAGAVAWRWLRAQALLGPDGVGRVLVGAQLDIDGRRADEERNRAAALRDSLTALPNRVVFDDRLAHALRGLVRSPGQRVVVYFLDLDGFKPINDRHGHAVGDDVLREVALRIRATFRESDTVARIGGDEFAAVMTCGGDPSFESLCREVSVRVRTAVEEPLTIAGRELRVGVSIGTAQTDDPQCPPLELLRRADHAMYLEKSQRTARPRSGPMRAVIRGE